MAVSQKRPYGETEMDLTRKALQRGGAGTQLSAQVVRRALEYARTPGSHNRRGTGMSAARHL